VDDWQFVAGVLPALHADQLTQGETRWRIPPLLSRIIAKAFLAGEMAVDPMVACATVALGKPWRWVRPLAERFVTAHAGQTRPRQRDAIRFLDADRGFRWVRVRYARQLGLARWALESHRMQPVPAAVGWRVPSLESAGALVEWLSLTDGELAWFADLKGLLARRACSPKLRHYHYRVLAKQSSGVRLIEAPKRRLKELQVRILTGILNRIPVHPAAHGFVKGRSIQTFVEPHVGQRVVLRMDLQDFFPSISGARMPSFFRTVGYPESVADLLGGICTNAVPRRLGRGLHLYARPHLPQGSPSSPALANLCAYRVDCRLTGLAKSAGARYTRYADDLAFSGGEEFERCVERFSIHVTTILGEEGFAVHHRKTRVMRQGVRQYLAGLVVNERVNVVRADFDRLKATLTNCARFGPESQNREGHAEFRAHLEGRVGFVETINPEKGNRLRAILERIQWA
jgi:retron-type reverse transcriptase